MSLEIPERFAGLFEPHRFKVFHGGRDGAKSWTFADALVNIAARTPKRIVCAREFQNSIEESVHHLLEARLKHYRLPFVVQNNRIFNEIGSEFIFKGLQKQDAEAIKSLEGADIVWVEEAQNVSEASWKKLIPTVRKEGSEIWVSFNPDTKDVPTYKRFVTNAPTGALVVKVGWEHNPWRSKVLDDDRRDMQRDDPESYDNVYGGNVREFAEGAYFTEQMKDAIKFGRIGDAPHDPSLLVWVFLDLGGAGQKSDPHAAWFIQATQTGTFNVMDYWEGNNVDLVKMATEVFIKRRDELGYKYAKIVIPHDGTHANRQIGKTDEDVLLGLGLPVETQERTQEKDKDVRNIRLVIPKCRFDLSKTDPGVSALKNYRQEKDEKTQLWKFKHNWASHGTDAFRGFSVYQAEHSMLLPSNDNVPSIPRRVVVC